MKRVDVMRRLTIWLAVFTLLMAVFSGSGCTSQFTLQQAGDGSLKTSGAGLKELRMGIVPLPHYAQMWVAKKKGFINEELQKVGFKLRWQPFSLGPMVNEAFIAGHVDMGVMGDFPAFIGRSAGINYRIISIASAAPKALALVVRQDSNIDAVSKLQGKKIATTKGAYGQKLLTLLLEKNGLSIQDIKFIHMTMDDLAIALARGDIDAGVIWDPLLTRLEDAGEIRIIADGTGVYEAYAVLMASGDLIDKHPYAVNAMLKAYQRGDEYLKQNPDECVKLLMEEMKIPYSQLAGIINKFNYDGTITNQFLTEMKDTEEFMNKNGLLKSRVDIQSIIYKK
jgi:sulfonate transport system substrate-binding protein